VSKAAQFILWINGILVTVVGAIHLWATPHVMRLMPPVAAGTQGDLAEAAMLLNHVVVGILLLPLGVGLVAVARPLSRKEPWSFWIGASSSLALLALPAVLAKAARPEMLQSTALATATAILSIASILVAGAVLFLALTPQARARPAQEIN
jgi:hypothetical protein